MVEATRESGSKTPAMENLVRQIRGIVVRESGAETTSREVADLLAGRVGEQDLLTAEQREASGNEYTQHIIHVEEGGAFSVVSLAWLAGQETPVHDHVAWCVPAVHEGREVEIQYQGVSRERGMLEAPGREDEVDFLVKGDEQTNREGDVTALTPPGDIHRVRNPGPGKAISIHVYGADIRELGSSIRRCYDQPVREGTRTE